MAYVVGRAHKPRKQNRKRLDNTTDPSSAPSTPSYSYDKLNENTDITRLVTAQDGPFALILWYVPKIIYLL